MTSVEENKETKRKPYDEGMPPVVDEEEEELKRIYNVVLSDEDQYSIWPEDEDIPNGWRLEGNKQGLKQECLDYIQEVWTDMRPRSLKEAMAKWPKEQLFQGIDEAVLGEVQRWREEDKKSGDTTDYFHLAQPPNKLVKSLMKEQPVELRRYRHIKTGEPERRRFDTAIELAYVLVRFTETTGGTELGLNLNRDDGTFDSDNVQFEDEEKQIVKLIGRCKLDFTPIRVLARIDLRTYTGTGHVEVIDDFHITEDWES